MSDQEFQLAVIAIVFGSAVAISVFVVIGMLINSFIKRKSKTDLTENEEFMDALRQFKSKTDRRLSNLEAIIENDDIDKLKASEPKSIQGDLKPANQKSIEFEPDEEKEKKDNQSSSGGNLKNMLKE